MSSRELITMTGFSQFLSEKLGIEFTPQHINETHAGRRPDFILMPANYLVEIKGIHDRNEVHEGAIWAAAVERLHRAIDANPKKQDVGASYVLDTPDGFRLPQTNELSEQMADDILDQLVAASPRKNIAVHSGGFEFNAGRYSLVPAHVSFARSWGGTINAAGTIHRNIFGKLADANAQLGYSPVGVEVSKRILLLDNEYTYGTLNNVIEALSYSFSELQSLDMVDEIWLQTEDRQANETKYELVLTKQFVNDFFNGEVSTDTEWAAMFGRWSVVLAEQDAYKDRILQLMRDLFQDHQPDELISDALVRSEIVRIIGGWLLKERRFDDAVWFVGRFINDSDPSASPTTEPNYDQEIRDGKEVMVITTVLGHLAWVVQGLTVSELHIERAFGFTKQLVDHPSLYVKLQALIPLIEITKRRQWLKSNDEANRTDSYGQLKALDFDLLRNYSQFSAIRDMLARVFFELRDLTTEEAVEVLDTLKDAENAYTLYVYFALFRKRHFLNEDGTQQVPFDARILEEKLKYVIRHYTDNSGLVDSLSWQFANLIRKTPEEFNTVKPWVEFLLEQPYQRNAYDDIEHVLTRVFEIDATIGVRWLGLIISKIYSFVVSASADEVRGSVWLSSVDDVIGKLAINQPDKLADCLKQLAEIWKKGVYIGDPEKIFTAYQYITNKTIHESIKQLSMHLYGEMKELHAKLKTFEWPD